MEDNIHHAATVFFVKSIEDAKHFYTEQLGFQNQFEMGNPLEYMILRRGKTHIHLSRYDTPSFGVIYSFCEDVDALHEEFVSKGVEIDEEIGDRPYQMRDFGVKDEEGNKIVFGCSIEG